MKLIACTLVIILCLSLVLPSQALDKKKNHKGKRHRNFPISDGSDGSSFDVHDSSKLGVDDNSVESRSSSSSHVSTDLSEFGIEQEDDGFGGSDGFDAPIDDNTSEFGFDGSVDDSSSDKAFEQFDAKEEGMGNFDDASSAIGDITVKEAKEICEEDGLDREVTELIVGVAKTDQTLFDSIESQDAQDFMVALEAHIDHNKTNSGEKWRLHGRVTFVHRSNKPLRQRAKAWGGWLDRYDEQKRLTDNWTNFNQPGVSALSKRKFTTWRRMSTGELTSDRFHEVNRWTNLLIRYKLDGPDNLWQTPYESFKRTTGDCEDYALAKYDTLKQLGVSANDMCISHVSTTQGAHMILLVKFQGQQWIMDNLNPVLRTTDEEHSYKPVYCLNDNHLYIFKPDV